MAYKSVVVHGLACEERGGRLYISNSSLIRPPPGFGFN
ncbi:hypothetical protein BN2497_4671 [Janthinobacterium sp. CG23_2]|nr:hypothetical protein BN2497_4671 [Janthinobacterium sp. CG23_2]CUU28733.1 hypothetical protein BN3177_4671 [Janthinobacterium sp. CG23_2]